MVESGCVPWTGGRGMDTKQVWILEWSVSVEKLSDGDWGGFLASINNVCHIYQLSKHFVTFQPQAGFLSGLANLCKNAI